MPVASRLIPILIAERMDASLRFYSDILGGVSIYRFPAEGDPGFVTLRIGGSEVALSDVRSSLPSTTPFRPATGHRIQLCVNVESVDEAVAAMSSIEIKVVMQPTDQPWGERAAYVEDPDGNLVLIVAPLRSP